MKRFLLFGGDNYYPCGGWDDFIGDFDTFEVAEKFARGCFKDWKHIVDTQSMQIVEAAVQSAR